MDENLIDDETKNIIYEDVRNLFENILRDVYDVKVNFRYGGSLAKGTANKNDFDIDILCYLDSNSEMTLMEIYFKTYDVLKQYFIVQKKRCAIKVLSKINDLNWKYLVDIVPGRYIDDSCDDVYLYVNDNDKERLKTNPHEQIKFVSKSKSKDLIRIIKFLRKSRNFKFKSFVLEIFAINKIEKLYNENDTLVDKLIIFCKNIDKLGVENLYDPANSENEVSNIHNSTEYQTIKRHCKDLLYALYTNNKNAVKFVLNGQYINHEDYYLYDHMKNVLDKSSDLFLLTNFPRFRIDAQRKTNISYKPYFGEDISKGIELVFNAENIPPIAYDEVRWLITNSGYEADKDECLRGDKLEDSNIESNLSIQNNKLHFKRKEYTKYVGNHIVQAFLIKDNKIVSESNIITVRIRNNNV